MNQTTDRSERDLQLIDDVAGDSQRARATTKMNTTITIDEFEALHSATASSGSKQSNGDDQQGVTSLDEEN